MLEVLKNHKAFYERITNGEERGISEELSDKGISILTGFIDNYDLVERFYSQFYSKDSRRIVLCGINPGRLGAGLTGVPFLDFKSMSQLLSGVNQQDAEKSAQFVFSVIKHVGVERFFDRVYLTNISFFGFVGRTNKKEKNFNYYDLPNHLQEHFIKGFVEEMKVVNPSVIIPLSQEVAKSLKGLKGLEATIGKTLWHPYYASFPTKEKEARERYFEVIQQAM